MRWCWEMMMRCGERELGWHLCVGDRLVEESATSCPHCLHPARRKWNRNADRVVNSDEGTDDVNFVAATTREDGIDPLLMQHASSSTCFEIKVVMQTAEYLEAVVVEYLLLIVLEGSHFSILVE
uniref:ShKT domain-containing protein n=1 Tax=Rodentolepis nana TaxID=102285 RepID=A0A0R3T1R6_RODNA